MSEYSSAIKLATKLITKKGKNVTITRSVSTAFDPVIGKDTPTTESMTVKAVVAPVSSRDLALYTGAATFERLNSILISGEGLPFRLEPLQTVTIEGEKWTALEVKPTNYNEGEPITYKAVLRI